MRLFTTTAATVGLLACIASVGQAADIREKQYGYRYGDAVNSMQEDAFLVCGDCGVDKLSRLPKRQMVTVAVQQPAAYQPVMRPAQPSAPWPAAEEYSDAPLAGGSDKQSSSHGSASRLQETVVFTFDSDQIRPEQKQKLDRLLSSAPKGAVLTVTGYTCEVGPKEHNQDLSRRRAENVARYLTTKGAKVAGVSGKGECCPTSKDKQLNRRVEIIEKEKN